VIAVAVLMSLLNIAGSSKGLKSRRSFTLLCLLAAIILAAFASRASDGLPLGIVLFDCLLVVLNFFGVLMSIFYVNKVELYAGLPQDLPYLPSFGPEDIPTGYKGANRDDRVCEEMVDVTQEVERETIVMSKPDREEHIEMVPLSEVRPLEVSESGLETE